MKDDKTLSNAEIVDIAKKQDFKEARKNNRKPKGVDNHRVKKINDLCRMGINRSEAEKVNNQEEQFAQNVVSGDSMADAYEQAYPDECWVVRPMYDIKGNTVTDANKEPIYERIRTLSYSQRFDKGNKLSRKPHIRAKIITLLEQEEGDVSHTARRLDNFIIKRLEHESTNPLNSASARISAIKELKSHQIVQTAETQAAKRAEEQMAPEEVIEQIKARVHSLTSPKE